MRPICICVKWQTRMRWGDGSGNIEEWDAWEEMDTGYTKAGCIMVVRFAYLNWRSRMG
jgi:hypothetical protein